MSNHLNQIACYILAGGKSSRMGEDKGLMLLHGKSIVQYLIDAVLPITSHIYIITSNPVYKQFNLPLLKDEIQNIGPAGGIDTMLHHTSFKKNIVLSCDMPFVNSKSVEQLIALSHDFEITCPFSNNYPELMFSIIQSSCQSRWREIINQNIFKLSAIIENFSLQKIDASTFLTINPFLFTNINNRSDFSKACWHLQTGVDIDATQFYALIHDSETQVIDVRNRHESPTITSFETVQIPLNELPLHIHNLNKSKKLIFICHAGIRSQEAIEYLMDEHHFTNVYHLKGGIIKLKRI